MASTANFRRQMSRTNNDSVTNLTKPQLYSFYENEDIDDDSNDLYDHLKEKAQRDLEQVKKSNSILHTKKTKHSSSPTSILGWIVRFITAIAILGVLGNLYIDLIEHLHTLNPILPNMTKYKLIHLLNINEYITKNLQFSEQFKMILNNSIEGILLGSMQPLFDKFIFHNTSPRPLFHSSNGDRAKSSIIRLFISFIGISYLLRKTEWNSSLQASKIWAFLNPLVWLLLDTTLTGFFSASLVSITAMLGYFVTSHNFELNDVFVLLQNDASDLLWIGSFIFIGLISFGKIGRYLYN